MLLGCSALLGVFAAGITSTDLFGGNASLLPVVESY